MDWTILWWVLAVLVVIAGLAGTIVPALPGVPLVFAGLLIGAWADQFATVGWATIGLLAVLALIAGVQLFCFGLLAELQMRTYHESQGRPIYRVRETLRGDLTGAG